VAAIALGRVRPITWPGLDDSVARVLGLGLGAAGLALLGWSLATLSRAGTTVRPDRPAGMLVTSGPYRFRRHPIYIADALILLGLAEVTKNVWLVILTPVFAILVTWLAIRPEERHLEARFGEAWRAYRDKTRLWL
jgi:protein-S-isoprenylcysteine O-methyltransferase Ste14